MRYASMERNKLGTAGVGHRTQGFNNANKSMDMEVDVRNKPNKLIQSHDYGQTPVARGANNTDSMLSDIKGIPTSKHPTEAAKTTSDGPTLADL